MTCFVRKHVQAMKHPTKRTLRPKSTAQTLAHPLRQARVRADLTQEELANISGLSRNALVKLENHPGPRLALGDRWLVAMAQQ